MESNIAIKFENISKQYRLGLVSTKTLSHDLNRWWQMTVLRRDDPYLKVGESNDRAKKGSSEYVWALRNINFDVKKGDVVGIIGKNGAGKSTLLKILSRVTAPTTGTIKAQGRIASLLEVGTGFHPELTGRENIYMNGSIMGMTKAEIARKLDEIVDFAGVERYIDTPVKRYSSGMTVRLGFSIAAHLEPEILVVDEVLAVGDVEFQQRAIGKMQDVSKGDGRTVLFVSHNMGAIRSLCQTGIVLANGSVLFAGSSEECVEQYLMSNKNIEMQSYVTIESKHRPAKLSREIEFVSVRFVENTTEFNSSDRIVLGFEIRCTKTIKTFGIFGSFWSMDQNRIGTFFSDDYPGMETGEVKHVQLAVGPVNLAPGTYYMNMGLGVGNHKTTNIKDYDWADGTLKFSIKEYDANKNVEFVRWERNWSNIVFNAEQV